MRLMLLVSLLLPFFAEAVCPVVTSTADTGAGTLRECLTLANGNPGRDVITFDPSLFRSAQPGVIAVQSDLPALTDPAGTEVIGNGAEAVVIDGAAYTPGVGFMLGSDGNTLRNLTVRNFRGTGFIEGTAIWIQNDSSSNEITGCVLHDNAGAGLNFDGNNADNIASGNVLRNNAYFGIRLAPSTATCATKNVISANNFISNGVGTGGDGLYAFGMTCLQVVGNNFEDNVSNFAFRLAQNSTQCLVSHNRFTANSLPVGVFGGSHDNTFSFNTFRNNRGVTFQLGDTGTFDNVIAGNVVLRNLLLNGESYAVYAYTGGDGTLIINNTFHQSEGSGLRVEPGVTRVRVQNNIFTAHTGQVLDLREPSVFLSNNDYFNNPAGECTSCTLGNGNLFTDPGYVSPGLPNDDYRLAACGSPLIDRGLDLGASQPDLTDLADGVRFFGSAPDIGALESHCASDGGVIMPPADGGTSGDGGVMIVTTPNTTASCGQPYAYSDGPARLSTSAQVLWIVESGPAGFTIGRNTGAVSWTPRGDQTGAQSVTIQAITQDGLIRQSFDVEVECKPLRLTVGCACGAAEGSALLSLGLFLLVARRRYRHCSP